jgi:hypothetical protein
VYLVSSCGEHGRRIFGDEGDRADFGELAAQMTARCGALVLAFVLLDTEILMVLKVNRISVSGVMQRLTALHARRMNGKRGYRGSLFQHPHRAVLLEDAVSVLEAVVTIHRSPLGMHLVRDPTEYSWSSHRAYLGLDEIPWLTKRVVLEYLGAMPEAQESKYAALMRLDEAWKEGPCLQGDGCPRTCECHPYDGFLAWQKKRSIELARPASLDQLIRAVGRWAQVDPAIIESKAWSPLLSLARGVIIWAAMQNGIASLAELGERFRRGRSTLHEIRETNRSRIPGVFDVPLADILAGPSIALSDFLDTIAGPAKESSWRKK